jgi:phenylacetate-coenzyme A ligase PaaK-like adenylate-forming protein
MKNYKQYQKLIKYFTNLDSNYQSDLFKSANFSKIIKFLHNHHFNNCPEYKNLSKLEKKTKFNFFNIPIIPVELFKSFDLKSIKNDNKQRILKSSGTSGTQSNIFLDVKNAIMQSIILKKLMIENIGEKKLPMIMFEKNNSNSKNNVLTAREAGVLGFSSLASEKISIENLSSQNLKRIKNFIKKYKNKKVLIFGFTDSIWKFFLKKKIKLNLSNCIVLHGGGWKKLEKFKINNKKFKKILYNNNNIKNVINYYGLVEQVGSIFFECKKGYFHTSVYSDIIIRDNFLNDLGLNKKGLVQLMSILPTSYPGISILTQDIGKINYIDNCPCGKKGKSFSILGRQAKAVVRGCSNVQ